MKMIDCLVADDEPLAREVMERYIAKTGQLHLIATCSNGIEVFNALKTKAAELLFLDIQMPHLTGIELLRTLKNPPAVIITTAFREFAIEGYELNVQDDGSGLDANRLAKVGVKLGLLSAETARSLEPVRMINL